MTGNRPEEAGEEARRAIEMAGDAFVSIDQAGMVVEWSRQAERTFGWSEGEASGRDLGLLVVRPEDLQRYRREFANLCGRDRTGTAARFLVEALHRRGNQFPVEVAVWTTSRGDCTFNVFFHDLSEQRQRDEAGAVGCHRGLVEGPDHLHHPRWHRDLSWNRAAEHLYGFSERGMVGQSVF